MTEKLNIAKRQAEIQQLQGVQQQSTPVQNADIPKGSAFANAPKTEEDPYMKVIRGEEFQTKTPQEQLEILKKQFPNVDVQELQNILDTANTIIKQEKDSSSPIPSEETTSDRVSPEEKAIKAAEEQGIKNANIDDIKKLAKVLEKQDPETLTENQKFLIEFAQTLEDKSKAISFIDKNADLFDNVIPKEVIESDEWKKLSPRKKLDAKLDALLEKVSPEYQKISDPSNKENYRNELLKQVVENLFQGNQQTEMSDAEKEYHISIVAMASDAAESKGLTMRQLIDMSRKEPEKLLNTVIDFADEKGLFSQFFNSETVISKNPKDDLMNLTKSVMKAADAEAYGKLSEEEQNRLAASAIIQIGKRLYGDSWKDTDKNGNPVTDPQEKLELNYDKVRSFALRFEAAKYSGAKTLNDVLNTSQKQQVAEERKYFKEVLKRDGVKPELEVEWQTREYLNKLRVTEDDKLNYLSIKQKTHGLSEEERKVKAEIEVHKQLGDKYYQELENLGEKRQFLKDNFNGNIYEFALAECGGDKAKLNELLKDEKYLTYLAIIANPHNKEDAQTFLENLGLEKNEMAINIFKTQRAFNRISQVKIDPNNENSQKEALAGLKDLDSVGHHDYVNKAYETVIPETKNEAFISTAYEQGLQMNYNMYKDSIAIGLNSEPLKEGNLGEKIAHNVLSSDNVSYDAKRALTSSYIEYALDDASRVSHANSLSDIDNVGVAQGLIDGRQYVKSKSAQTQYDNAVTKSVNSVSDPVKREQLTASHNEAKASSGNNSDSNTNRTSTSNNNSVSNTSQTTAKTTATATASATASANSAAKATSDSSQNVKVSTKNSNAVMEMKAQLAQVNYEHSVALRDKAIADLERIIDKIQNDQQVRAQKQAELAAKEAKTDEEIAQAIKEAEAKATEKQEQVQKQITEETMAELEQQEKLEKKYNISIETINELRSAAKQGDLNAIYTKLGSISSDAQKHFIQYLSRKDAATIIGFIRNRSTDKALIKELCMLNPALIKSLDASLLLDCGIAKADIIKYSDSHQLSILMYDLAKIGNLRELNQFYDALGDNAQQVAGFSNTPVPGDDRYYAMLNRNMSTASNKVPMRQDINKKVPRELWG